MQVLETITVSEDWCKRSPLLCRFNRLVPSQRITVSDQTPVARTLTQLLCLSSCPPHTEGWLEMVPTYTTLCGYLLEKCISLNIDYNGLFYKCFQYEYAVLLYGTSPLPPSMAEYKGVLEIRLPTELDGLWHWYDLCSVLRQWETKHGRGSGHSWGCILWKNLFRSGSECSVLYAANNCRSYHSQISYKTVSSNALYVYLAVLTTKTGARMLFLMCTVCKHLYI